MNFKMFLKKINKKKNVQQNTRHSNIILKTRFEIDIIQNQYFQNLRAWFNSDFHLIEKW